MAKSIADLAFKNGSNSKYLSPFAKEAWKNGYQYIGGKLDDITVVVTLI